MKRRGGPPSKDGRNDSVFKKPKLPAHSSSVSAKRGSRTAKSPSKSKSEEIVDLSDEELRGGDSFFAESEINNRKSTNQPESDSGSEEENVDEARLRQGKAYLAKITRKSHQDPDESGSEEEMDMDTITNRVAEDALQATGRMSHRAKADSLIGMEGAEMPIKILRGHKSPVTVSRISDDETTIYSAGKDCCIVKWDLESGKKLAVYKGYRGKKNDQAKFPGHSDHVLALSLTSDGKFLASGGKDKMVLVWETEKDEVRDGFKGHKDAVTALAFRLGSHDLYSGSNDRTLKLWNVDEMSYVDTLFGHKAEITAIDSLARERPVTSSLDKTAAVWKVLDEVHLEYIGPKTHLFAIALLNEDIFVTGGQDGSIHLWSTQKRKPLFEYKLAHGAAPRDSFNWITSLGALRYSDLFASGSATGEIRLWKLSDSKDSFSLVTTIPHEGVINSLQFSKSGKYLVAGVGQEPRMGRWIHIQPARNGTAIIQLAPH